MELVTERDIFCLPKEQFLMLTGGGTLSFINSRGEYLLDESQGSSSLDFWVS
jgi:hypothetical protein